MQRIIVIGKGGLPFATKQVLIHLKDGHSRIKLDIDNRRESGKLTHLWELINKLLNIQWVEEEITREI